VNCQAGRVLVTEGVLVKMRCEQKVSWQEADSAIILEV